MIDNLSTFTETTDFEAVVVVLCILWVLAVGLSCVAVAWDYAGRAWLRRLEGLRPELRYARVRIVRWLRDLGDRLLPMPSSLPGAALVGYPVASWDLLTDAQRRQVLTRGHSRSLTSGADSPKKQVSTPNPLTGKSRVLAFGAGAVPATVDVRQATARPSDSPVPAAAAVDAAAVPSPDELEDDGLPLFVQITSSIDVEMIARTLHRAAVVAVHFTADHYREETFDALPLSVRARFRRDAMVAVRAQDPERYARAIVVASVLAPDFERALEAYERILIDTVDDARRHA